MWAVRLCCCVRATAVMSTAIASCVASSIPSSARLTSIAHIVARRRQTDPTYAERWASGVGST